MRFALAVLLPLGLYAQAPTTWHSYAFWCGDSFACTTGTTLSSGVFGGTAQYGQHWAPLSGIGGSQADNLHVEYMMRVAETGVRGILLNANASTGDTYIVQCDSTSTSIRKRVSGSATTVATTNTYGCGSQYDHLVAEKNGGTITAVVQTATGTSYSSKGSVLSWTDDGQTGGADGVDGAVLTGGYTGIMGVSGADVPLRFFYRPQSESGRLVASIVPDVNGNYFTVGEATGIYGDGTYDSPTEWIHVYGLKETLNTASRVTIWGRGTITLPYSGGRYGMLVWDVPNVTIRGYLGDPLIFDNSAAANADGFSVAAADVWLEDVTFTNSQSAIRVTNFAGSNPNGGRPVTGIDIDANDFKLRRAYVTNMGDGIFHHATAQDTLIEDVVCAKNGWDGPDRGHGHCPYYASDITAGQNVVRNFVSNRHPVDGLHFTSGKVNRVLFDGVFAYNDLGQFMSFAGNDSGHPFTIQNSMLPQAWTTGGNLYGSFLNNYMAISTAAATSYNLTFTGNDISGGFTIRRNAAETGLTIDNNTYHSAAATPFTIGPAGGPETAYSWVNYRAAFPALDANSTFTATSKPYNQVSRRPSPTAPQLMVAIANRTSAATETVNVLPELAVGDPYEVMLTSAMESGPVLTGTVPGDGNIAVPLTGLPWEDPGYGTPCWTVSAANCVGAGKWFEDTTTVGAASALVGTACPGGMTAVSASPSAPATAMLWYHQGANNTMYYCRASDNTLQLADTGGGTAGVAAHTLSYNTSTSPSMAVFIIRRRQTMRSDTIATCPAGITGATKVTVSVTYRNNAGTDYTELIPTRTYAYDPVTKCAPIKIRQVIGKAYYELVFKDNADNVIQTFSGALAVAN